MPSKEVRVHTACIFTIGYEERSIDEFISRLRRHKITVLVDVRETPASRKRGFSKGQLEEILREANIKYLHVKCLGSPKALRDRLREDNDYEAFFAQYMSYIETQSDALRTLYKETVSQETSCLMCMERRPEYCHRSVLAKKIKEIDGNGLEINHI
jgi:uncharacterized protein (DUF488 family)